MLRKKAFGTAVEGVTVAGLVDAVAFVVEDQVLVRYPVVRQGGHEGFRGDRHSRVARAVREEKATVDFTDVEER